MHAGATGAGDGLALLAPRPDGTAAGKQAAARRTWWQRLCLPSFAVGAVTIVIVWIAVTTLLRQGRLDTVLSAGRAELASGTPSGAGPRPCPGRVLPRPARHRRDPADDLAQRRGGDAAQPPRTLDRAAGHRALAVLAD